MSYDSELDDALDDGVLSAAEQRILKRLDSKKLRQFLNTQGDDYKIVDRPNQGEVNYESLGADTPLKQYLVDSYNERDKNFQGERIYETVKQQFPGATALDIRESLTDLDMNFGKETRNYPQKLEDEWVSKQRDIINEFDYGGEATPDRVKIDVREWLYDKRNKGVYDSVMRGEDPGSFRIDTIQEYKGGAPRNSMNIPGKYELQFYANDQLYGTAPAETEDDDGMDDVRSVDDFLEMSGVTDSTFEGMDNIELKKRTEEKMDKFENRTDKIIESASNINKGFKLGKVPTINMPKLTNIDKLKDRISNDGAEFKKLPKVNKFKPSINDPSGAKRKDKLEKSKLGPVGSRYKAPNTKAFKKGNPSMPSRPIQDPLSKSNPTMPPRTTQQKNKKKK